MNAAGGGPRRRPDRGAGRGPAGGAGHAHLRADGRGRRRWPGTAAATARTWARSPTTARWKPRKAASCSSDVRAGSPAAQAGIRGGDRLVGLAGTRIANLYDMTYALQDHKPGETVDVVVMRDGERITLRAVLGERGAPAATPARPAAAQPASSPAIPRPGFAQPASAPAIDAFYADRPGPAFAVGAGRPFAAIRRRAPPRRRPPAHLRRRERRGLLQPRRAALIFQATTAPGGCDQQYVMDLATGDDAPRLHRQGRTTCGYFDWPEADRVVYASTQAAATRARRRPTARRATSGRSTTRTTSTRRRPAAASRAGSPTRPGYDAEATWCHRGGALVFTSVRDGDLDLYVMDEAGGDAAPHRHARLRRRRVLQPRLRGDRLAGQPPDGGRARRLPRAARAGAACARTRWRSSS